MTDLSNYYKMTTNTDDTISFTKIKMEDIKICGKTVDEIIDILNSLEIERITGIKITMENLSYLYKKLCEEQATQQRKILNERLLKEEWRI